MFAAFQSRALFPFSPPPHKRAAEMLFTRIMAHSRQKIFYTDYCVPDTLCGRFDLLSLHVALVLRVLRSEGREGKALGQALFDSMFSRLEQDARQTGVGDPTLPKHMKTLMRGAHGRAHAYDLALDSAFARQEGHDGSPDMLCLALGRNLYGQSTPAESHTDFPLDAMACYVMAYLRACEACGLAGLCSEACVFPLPEPVS